MICEKCGTDVQISDWPFCPHPPATGLEYHEDAVPGGFTVENGFDRPTTFYSHSEHRAALAARGMEIVVKWAGEHDKHVKRWDIPDATTLANAAALVSRTKSAPFAPEAYDPMPIDVTTVTFEEPR